jgi:hypothetical protein
VSGSPSVIDGGTCNLLCLDVGEDRSATFGVDDIWGLVTAGTSDKCRILLRVMPR